MLRDHGVLLDHDDHVLSSATRSGERKPQRLDHGPETSPTRRVAQVGRLLAKGEVFERQLRAGTKGGTHRSKEAHEQGGHRKDGGADDHLAKDR